VSTGFKFIPRQTLLSGIITESKRKAEQEFYQKHPQYAEIMRKVEGSKK